MYLTNTSGTPMLPSWRFMLSLIAQASIFGGYGASKVIETIREGNHGQ